MALMTCPSCGQRVSDRLQSCPACNKSLRVSNQQVSEVPDQELQRRQLRDRIYRANMWLYTAIACFLVAVGWYWYLWTENEYQLPQSRLPLIAIIVSALLYLAVRMMLMRLKSRYRKLRKSII